MGWRGVGDGRAPLMKFAISNAFIRYAAGSTTSYSCCTVYIILFRRRISLTSFIVYQPQPLCRGIRFYQHLLLLLLFSANSRHRDRLQACYIAACALSWRHATAPSSTVRPTNEYNYNTVELRRYLQLPDPFRTVLQTGRLYFMP